MYHMVLVNANIWINLKCYTRNKTSIQILHVFVNILNIEGSFALAFSFWCDIFCVQEYQFTIKVVTFNAWNICYESK